MKNTVAFYFTDPIVGADPLEVIPLLPKKTGIIFRHYNHQNRTILAHKAAILCKKHKIGLLIASDPKLAQTIKASGCHLPEHQIHQAPMIRKKLPGLFISAACHSERSVHLAVKYGCDIAFLSPIYPTASHPNAPCRRLHPSALIAQRAAIPVFGLGGINTHNWRQLSKVGFSGFGAIRSLENRDFSDFDLCRLR